MFIFIHGWKSGTGTFYIHIEADSVNPTVNRTKIAENTGYSSWAAVYTPRIWNETSSTWVSSPQVEVSIILSKKNLHGARFSTKQEPFGDKSLSQNSKGENFNLNVSIYFFV